MVPELQLNDLGKLRSAYRAEGLLKRVDAMLVERPSILITDDDREFRETLRVVLETRGFRTLLAGDGEEALSIVRSSDVHLLLLDMHMPKLSGLETVCRLRQFQSRLPCILISAALDDRVVEQAERANIFSVLAKPVSRFQLTSTVDLALRRTYGWEASAPDRGRP